MKVLSLFDGISCGRLALERAGIPVEKYYASEIDKYAISVAQAMYPDTIQIGDVNKIHFTDYMDIDLLIGGSPCQDLSIAKQNRQGLRGERSGLFWRYVDALATIRPKYFLLENVASMRNEDRDAITETLRKIYPNTECIMINSALVSAQQRKRYYWTNWHVEQPKDKGILLKDILESGVVDRSKSLSLSARYVGNFGSPEYTIKRYVNKGFSQIVAEPIRVGEIGKDGQEQHIYSVRDSKIGLYKVDLPDGDYIIRKLTPRECCRLQTYDERCFDVANISNTQWYKAFGNGWTVDVIAHVLNGIK